MNGRRGSFRIADAESSPSARTSAPELLRDMVQKGLVADIFRAERSIALLKSIGGHAAEINRGTYSPFFSATHAALATDALLAISRMHDRRRKRRRRCLAEVVGLLTQHHAEFPAIREPYQLRDSLVAMNAPVSVLESAAGRPAGFPLEFARFVESLLDATATADDLARLREMRNQTLAHNGRVAEVPSPTWNALERLVGIAKSVVGILGWAYLGVGYDVAGDYILTSDAQRPARASERLLAELASTNR